MGIVSRTVIAGCAILIATASAGAQQTPLADAITAANDVYSGPFAYQEQEPVVVASPSQAIAFDLPPGSIVRDYEAAPTGGEVAAIIEDADHRQHLAFWTFAVTGFAHSLDIPPQTRITSLTWHPNGKAVFLLASGATGSQILKADATGTTFVPQQVYATSASLRRLVVGPRPFQVSDQTGAELRLFFGEKLSSGAYALRTVSETGKAPYTVVGPQRDSAYQGRGDEAPNTTIAPFGLPVQFHPAGNVLIWEDEKRCLHKIGYGADNWAKSEPFGRECGHAVTYTPNGIATIDWQSGRPGIHLRGLIDGTDQAVLAEFAMDSVPSHMPDGRGVVAVTSSNGRKTLRYLPINVPLANVANAWMYTENAADQQAFVRDRGLFRPLPASDQLFQLYDTESYQCGEPDVRIPTRPYLVTTDLFWELYSAAFDGLFIILERGQAMPAFSHFVAAADAELRARHPDTAMAKAFAAARAVLENHSEGNAEARLIVAAKGRDKSLALDQELDFGEFRPRGHYTSEEQKRYFAAVRYLSALPLSPDDTALLRGLGPAIGKAALDWIAVYKPFIATSRLDLVWGGAASTIASHPDSHGTRLFPLSWGWDNEALDNVIDHAERPAIERVVTADGSRPRMLPSGLDFAAIAGDRLAGELLDRSGVLATYPNLAARLAATRKRFAAARSSSSGSSNLYDGWIAALARQWADATGSAIAGSAWDAKRLQTGLASWATLRHATVLVNDKAAAECGESGFESIVMRPPRGYVEPDPATFAAIADLFDATIAMVRAGPVIAADAPSNTQLRDGIIRRLTESRDNVRKYQKIAEKELQGDPLSAADYELIQYVGRAAEHNFLIFASLSNPQYALSNPDPMMKVVDVASGLEAGIGRPLEWDQIVPYFGRSEIVKGGIYSYYEFASGRPMDDGEWRRQVDSQARPDWVARHMSGVALSCPARQP